jgi:hypothetical protein
MTALERIAQIRQARNAREAAAGERVSEERHNARLARLEAEEAAEAGGGLTIMTRETLPRIEASVHAATAATSPVTSSVPALSSDPDIAAAQRTAAALRVEAERQRNTVTLADGTAFVVDPGDAAGTAARLNAFLREGHSRTAQLQLADFLAQRARDARSGGGVSNVAAVSGGFSPGTRALLPRMGFTQGQIAKMDREVEAELRAQADVGGAKASEELARMAGKAGVSMADVTKYSR